MTGKSSEIQPRRGPRITRVTTKTGDEGETGLAGGQRVGKDHPRIEAYGTVDELSSFLGGAVLAIRAEADNFRDPGDARRLAEHLVYIQNQLFTIGGDLATRFEDRHPSMPIAAEEHVAYLERLAGRFGADLPPLADFILPGGSQPAVALHQARTVCRRAERAVTAALRRDEINPLTAVYLNRLSDVLFILGRWVNAELGRDEPTWSRELPEPPL